MAASKKAFSDSLATDERFKAVHQHLGIPVMQQSSILKSIKSSRHHILRRELDMLLEHLEEELGDPSQD